VSKSITVAVIGDVNGDGVIAAVDALMTTAYVKSGAALTTDIAKYAANAIRNDSNIIANDAIIINAFVKGKRTYF
jgi:hypothetical protein